MARDNNNGVQNGYQLPFEKPILHLQRHIAELATQQRELGRDFSSEIHRLRGQSRSPAIRPGPWRGTTSS